MSSCELPSTAQVSVAQNDRAKRRVATTKANSSRRPGRMTGPRTTAGKNRSRYNAVKAGIFSKVVVLKDESRTEYEALLTGYRDHFQPDGTFENSLVDKLAMLDWRRKRLVCAETAEIESSTRFSYWDSVVAQKMEAWDASRAGESAGGMLRKESNPYIIRKAIEMLKLVRNTIEDVGFQGEDYDTWLLEKIYGVDHDGAPSLSLFHTFVLLSKIAALNRKESNEEELDKLKEQAVQAFDRETKRLETWAEEYRSRSIRRQLYKSTAALVPEQSTVEKFVRYEAHLSREFDRTLNQLERCQRMRLGQPVLPAIKVDVAS